MDSGGRTREEGGGLELIPGRRLEGDWRETGVRLKGEWRETGRRLEGD